MGFHPYGAGTSERGDQFPVLACCSGERYQARKSFAAFGCGAALKIAAVNGQIGSGSSCEKAMACISPRFFWSMLMLAMVSNVTRLSPDAMLRTTPRCPWMKRGSFAMYRSIYFHPYFWTML